MSTTEEFWERLERTRKFAKESAGLLTAMTDVEVNESRIVQLVMPNWRNGEIIEPKELNVLGCKRVVATLNAVTVGYSCTAGKETVLSVNGKDLSEWAGYGVVFDTEGRVSAHVGKGRLYAIAVSMSVSVDGLVLGAKLLEFDTSVPGTSSLKRVTYFDRCTSRPVFLVNYRGTEIIEIVTYDERMKGKFIYNGTSLLQPGFTVDTSSFLE